MDHITAPLPGSSDGGASGHITAPLPACLAGSKVFQLDRLALRASFSRRIAVGSGDAAGKRGLGEASLAPKLIHP
ncbi:MAG: hypothetical protein R3C56_43595 [Pirellulaceae bacterium]